MVRRAVEFPGMMVGVIYQTVAVPTSRRRWNRPGSRLLGKGQPVHWPGLPLGRDRYARRAALADAAVGPRSVTAPATGGRGPK